MKISEENTGEKQRNDIMGKGLMTIILSRNYHGRHDCWLNKKTEMSLSKIYQHNKENSN